MRPVAIALGANLGDRLAQMQAALDALSSLISWTAASPVYETAPAGLVDQPAFLNAVALGESAASARAILEACLACEAELGRRRDRPQGPRLIDLDLLLAGDEVWDEPGLEVPHPRLHERAFVLLPLCDVAPEWRHPILGRRLAELPREALAGPIQRRCPERLILPSRPA